MDWNLRIKKLSKSIRASIITINIQNYLDSISDELDKLLEYTIQKKEESKKSSLTKSEILSDLETLYGRNSKYYSEFETASEWKGVSLVYRNLLKDNIPYELSRKFRTYLDKLTDMGEGSTSDLEKDFENSKELLKTKTLKNAESLSDLISKAISRVEGWNAPIQIIAHPSKDLEDGCNSFEVSVHRKDVSFFAMIDNSNIVIDDILEGGELDIFKSNIEQEDYFNLIKELKNPGSTSKPGKKKVLYTARPVKDRQRYLDTNHIPVNIFLTSNIDDAIGLAYDLAGSGVRDVWKIIMDDKYLIQTLEGNVKQFQTVGRWDQVPIIKSVLIIPGN